MSRMLAESQEAAARVRDVLAADSETYQRLGARLRELNPTVVATLARGSSDHVANYASYLVPLCTGKVVASIAPSLVSVLDAKLAMADQLVLAISQGGRSPDLIGAFERCKAGGALTAAVVNDGEAPIAKLADYFLPQHAGPEGIAATKTVLCSLTAIARLVAEWCDDAEFRKALTQLPAVLELAGAAGTHLDASALAGVSNAYVLSRGLGLCAALETALKLKETCGLHAEAFSTAEVRHGPREIVAEGFLVIALAVPGSGRDDVLAAARELEGQGARVMLVDLATLEAPLDPRLSPIVMLQMLYPWLARASVARGLDPDRPRTLKSKIIETF
jgi:glucosamine--fructose-6-phosphate aminotransferase (isomerizing)